MASGIPSQNSAAESPRHVFGITFGVDLEPAVQLQHIQKTLLQWQL